MNSQRTVNSASLFSRALRVMPGGNSRTTVYSSPYPLYAASGMGSRVTDVDGVVRLDAINNFTALIHGHAQPDVLAAVQEQIRTGICFGMPTKSEIDLAELLCDRLRSAERVRFTNSGTEAVMAAIKAARAFTRRSKIAKCEGAYHGAYDVAEVSQTAAPSNWGDQSHPRSVPVSFATPARVLDDVIVLPLNRVEESESLLRKYGPEIAAILIDPLPNRAGLISASPEFLAMIRRVATDIGSLLVSDEVISFRLGYHGAQGRFAYDADLTALGKFIGGGFPVGAVAGRADVMSVFDPTGGNPLVSHGGTFNANPVSMVAGLKTMQLLTPGSFSDLDRKGDLLREMMTTVCQEMKVAVQVVGLGSLLRVHFSNAPLHDYRSAYFDEIANQKASALHAGFLRHGVVIAPYCLIALSTAMSDGDIHQIVHSFQAALEELISARLLSTR